VSYSGGTILVRDVAETDLTSSIYLSNTSPSASADTTTTSYETSVTVDVLTVMRMVIR